MRTFLALLTPLLCSTLARADHDVVIYGGSSSGIAAAIQVVRMGKTAIIIEPSKHIGGLTTGGLGWTDSGSKDAVGGISREFYQRVKKYYDDPKAWVHEKQETYKFYRKDEDAMWTFEPRVAEDIYKKWLAEVKVEVVYGERIDRTPGKGVKKENGKIASITMESGKTYAGKMFIDATYEGDLMASAGVSFHVGREANATYNETLNGMAKKLNNHNHKFVVKVDPFITPGKPESGLLPGIEKTLPEDGVADHRMQAYCYRMCMSNIAANRIPFPKPEGYDEKQHELLLRNFEAGDLRLPLKPDMMPNGKTDTNNNCAVSTDYIGGNYYSYIDPGKAGAIVHVNFAEADYKAREYLIQSHRLYQQGLMWTLQNHPRVPQKIRDQMAKWGLTKDEFTDSGNWGHQIYVRESRRMIGDVVHNENHCRRKLPVPDSVGMGSYNMDSHNCTRYVTPDGFAQNEGDIQISPGGPYQIGYKTIVPKEKECSNLLVPVCMSSSHIAYGSIRMEPVFMVLGQSSATAAVMAINDGTSVQAVPYDKLSKKLLEDKQVLTLSTKGQGLDPKKLEGIVVDDEQAERKGFDSTSSANAPYYGFGYRHDNNQEKGKQSAKYTPELKDDGKYEVRMSYPPNANRASNLKVIINHAEGSTSVTVDQRKKPTIDGAFVTLGSYSFKAGKTGHVLIGNEGTDGYVVIDTVVWIKGK